MINSVTVMPQDVAVNENVLFINDKVRTKSCGCKGWLSHENGSGIFTLTKPGIYEVLYNANISSATPGELFLELKRNGEAIIGTRSIYTSAAAEAFGNVSASTLVVVPCGASMTITLGNTSTIPLSVRDANIIIKKIA